MRLIATCGVVLLLGACSDSEPGPVVLTDAVACSTFHVLLVSADEEEAMTASVPREQFESLDGPTEFDLAELEAKFLSGANLSGASCTDVGGNVRVDDTEDVDEGTLTITVDGGRAGRALRGAVSGTTTIEDAAFGDVFIAPASG